MFAHVAASVTIAATIAVAFTAGVILGTRYGRAAEQKIVATALAELGDIDAAAHSVLLKLSTRLGYLKKAL